MKPSPEGEQMSIIRAAKKYGEMRAMGLTIDQISEQTGVPPTAIHERLQLLTLTPEEQQMVKNNQLSMFKALKLCEKRAQANSLPTASDATPPSYESA
jgi:ParB-like chromosome segregation protein Spo0J